MRNYRIQTEIKEEGNFNFFYSLQLATDCNSMKYSLSTYE